MLRPFTSARSICVEITNECLLRASRSPLPLSTHAPHNRSFSRQNSPSRAQPQISRRYDVRSYSSQKPERPEKQRHAIPQILRMARINIYVRIDGRMRFILRRKAKEERYLDLRTSEFSVYTESWGNYLLRMGWIPVTLSGTETLVILPGHKSIFASSDVDMLTDYDVAGKLAQKIASVLLRHIQEEKSGQLFFAPNGLSLFILFSWKWWIPVLVEFEFAKIFISIISSERSRNRKADRLGMRLMDKAGFDTFGAISAWEKTVGLDSQTLIDLRALQAQVEDQKKNLGDRKDSLSSQEDASSTLW